LRSLISAATTRRPSATMTTAKFCFNNVVICYNCRKQPLGYIKASNNPENRALGVIFVSCEVCLIFPHVYNPRSSLQKRYIDVWRYSEIINSYACAPNVWKEKRSFSITKLGFKTVAQIEDCQTVCRLLGGSFAIVDDNGEGSKFFSNACPTRKVTPSFIPQGLDTADPNSVNPLPPYSEILPRSKELSKPDPNSVNPPPPYSEILPRSKESSEPS
jgi:hypothetical protein